jgi:hypothetical protein
MNPLTQVARETRDQLRRENLTIAIGCGIVGAAGFTLFILKSFA